MEKQVSTLSYFDELVFVIYGHEYFSSHRVTWVRNFLIFLYTLFSFIGVSFNIFVVFLLVVWHRKALRNITNTFVLALAISDIVMSGFNMPMQAFYEMEETAQFSTLTCKVIFSTFGLPMHISCLVILVIGIDRYHIIIYPLRRRMTQRTAAMVLLALISASLVFVLPIAIFSESIQATTSGKDTQYQYCVEHWPSPEIRLSYTAFTFTVQFLLPLMLTSVLYARIYFRLHESRFRKRDLVRKKRTNKILIGVVVCFFLCWTPWNVFSLVLEFHAYILQKQPFEIPHGQSVGVDLLTASEILLTDLKTLFNKTTHISLSENERHQELLEEIHRSQHLVRSLKFSSFNASSFLFFGGHAKLIDLILKLLAMCSGCFNPCLYGCMSETMRLLMKRAMTRFIGFHRRGVKNLKSRVNAFPFTTSSNKSAPQNYAFKSYKSTEFEKPLYYVHFCGFQFVVRTGFHHQNGQVKNLFQQNDKSDFGYSQKKKTPFRRYPNKSTNGSRTPTRNGMIFILIHFKPKHAFDVSFICKPNLYNFWGNSETLVLC